MVADVDNTFPMMMTPHPLLVDHIVEKVLEYASHENLPELFNLRQVCSQWNFYATKLLQKKYYLSFGGHKYNIGRLKTFLDEFYSKKISINNSESENWETRSNNGENVLEFPVTRFRLFSDLFQECNKETVMDFMLKCGPTAEALVIFKDINSDIEYTNDELSQLTFPKLKELTFSDRRRCHFSHDANSQTFLFQIISSAKENLTSLSIKYPREPIYEIYEKEQLIIKVFQQCEMPRLERLKLDMSVTDKILKTLSLINLKITRLHLCLGASQFSPESLKNLLHSLRYTLEDLRLTELYRRASLVVDLPQLECIKSFEIHGLELPAYFVTFPDFTYESKLPNLRKLKLNTWAPIKAWEVFVPETPEKEKPLEVNGVKELSLAMNFDCPILMRRAASMFTGVKSLEMHFSRATVNILQSVFKFMPQLEELKLNQSYLGEIATNCIDDVLTGLEPEECKWLLKKKAYRSPDLIPLDKKPNLTNLKNLKRFDMLGLRHRNMVTDLTAYLVFLQMDHLCMLDIGRSELSDSCLKELAEKFPNGKFQKYLSKKRMRAYDSGLYKNSVFTSICSVQ